MQILSERERKTGTSYEYVQKRYFTCNAGKIDQLYLDMA